MLPSFNERGTIEFMIQQLLALRKVFLLEVLVVDDDSPDGTAELVRQLARKEPCLRLIRRVGRSGLASAIKEGLLNATGDIALVMDSDGQHEPAAVQSAVTTLLQGNWDLVVEWQCPLKPAQRLCRLERLHEWVFCVTARCCAAVGEGSGRERIQVSLRIAGGEPRKTEGGGCTA